MRYMLLLLTAFSCLMVQAQSDFTRDDFYKVGDTANYFGVDATNIDPGPTGNGVTWDFSGLQRRPDEDFFVEYAAPSAAPNASQFPEANMVAIQDAGPINAYSFFYATDNLIRLEGLDLPDLGVVTYSDKSEWLDLPFNFNDTQTDPFIGQYTFSVQGLSGISNRDGSLTTKYDGFGTVILPDGTRVPNVRRLKLDQTVNDKVTVSGFTITTKVVTTTYHFFAEDERLQIFTILIADSTVTPPGTTVHSEFAYYRTPATIVDPPVAANRRGPHLTAQGGAFDSQIIIRNPTDTAQMLTLTPLDGSGSALTPQTLQLGPGAISRTLQQQLFPQEAQSFEAEGCDACIFSVGYRANIPDGSTAQVHQFSDFEKEVYFYPGEWEALFDGAAIINAGDANANIEATQYDDNGAVLREVTLINGLAPGGKELVLFNDVLVDDPTSIIRISSEQPMAVMTLRISSDFRFLYQNLTLPSGDLSAEDRWIPHVTSDNGGFATDIVIHNSATTPQTVMLHPYSADGNALSTVSRTIPAGQTQRFSKAELFDSAASHVNITGSKDCVVSAGYRANAEGSSTALSHETQPMGQTLYVYPGEWDVLFDGVAIVNSGSGNATITLTQISDNGQTLATATLVEGLAPNAKYLGLYEGLIPEDANTILRIDSTQPMAILSLRLSKDGRYLYNNNPQ